MKNFKIYFWHNIVMDAIEGALVNLTNFIWSQRRKYEKEVISKIKGRR